LDPTRKQASTVRNNPGALFVAVADIVLFVLKMGETNQKGRNE